MEKGQSTAYKQRAYLGRFLVALGIVGLLADLSFLVQPLALIAGRFREGLLGMLPTVGMCILDATYAIAFHQADYVTLVARILILFSAVVGLVAGISLLQPKSSRPLIVELSLSPEFEEWEITNGPSR